MSVKHRQKGFVYVAMSGGVDSSVAALLLKHAGWRVVGVYMKPWQPVSPPVGGCMWQTERADALRVAATLNIPLETWDFSREYGRKVAHPMVQGYRRGVTPNPDVDCNKEIKFGLFYRKAMRRGADFVATGHYARIRNGMLVNAKDTNKDQTYFLWAINPACLKRTLFPIGHLTKPQVRALAAKAHLPTASKKDSQGVCFVGQLNVKDFLAARIKPKAGTILHTDGRVIGTHDGAAYYTIGQRHGLDIKDGNGPYFVVAKDMQRNTVTVGAEHDLYSSTTRLTATNWFGRRPKKTEKVLVKIRYRTPAYAATISPNGRLVFTKPVRAITPGQSAVIYKGTRLFGGGVMV